MPLRRKPNLSRFKKTSQGMIEFASLIEQSDPKHREDIIKQVEGEDPDFLADVMKKVVYFEQLTNLDEGILSEILSKVSPKIMAFALRGMPEDFRNAVFHHIGHRGLKEVQNEEETMNSNIDESFIMGARKQILKIARFLEAEGKFTLDLHTSPHSPNSSALKKSYP